MPKRDFNVKVVDAEGNVLRFKATDCETTDKTLATKIGFGDVKETIKCKKYTIKEEKKRHTKK